VVDYDREMAKHTRWVVEHRGLLLLSAALLGGALASLLHGQDAPRTCVGSPASPACVERGQVSMAAAVARDELRVEIPTEGLPHKGADPADANVTMIECSDFGCPYSKRAAGSVDQLIAQNHDLSFFHVHFPLGLFEHSVLKARAGAAAQRQDRFWSMHDALYDASLESEADAVELARRLGLDSDRFAADLRDPGLHAEVERQRALCKDVGVRAVPTFFINGRRVIGSIPTDQLQRIIDEERR
jgi:protein-disulfide isomerase